MKSAEAYAARFVELFTALDQNGKRKFSRNDLLAALPLFIKPVADETLPADGFAPLLEEASRVLNVTAKMDEQAIRKQIEHYYKTHDGPLKVYQIVIDEIADDDVDVSNAVQNLARLRGQ